MLPELGILARQVKESVYFLLLASQSVDFEFQRMDALFEGQDMSVPGRKFSCDLIEQPVRLAKAIHEKQDTHRSRTR